MPLPKSLLTTCLATAFLIGTHVPANAQGAQVAFGGLQHDNSLPVEITSDQLSVDQSSGKATFRGDVLIGQGSLRLSAQNVEVIYSAQDTSDISKLIANGNVVLVNGAEAIEAQRAEYDLKAASVFLSGNVILTQGASALSGERMTVNLNNGTGRIEGRVKTILQSGAQ